MTRRKKFLMTGIGIGSVLLFLLLTFQIRQDNSWKSWALPLSGKVIILDPGHGGVDGGASKGGVLEKDIALNICIKLQDYLQEQGALVIMTRETDDDLASEDTRGYRNKKREDLQKRVELINDSEADLFISLHLNSFPSSSSKGAQTFYSVRYQENEKVAKFIQEELVRNMENTKRKAKPIGNIYILRNAKKPGVLVEAGFLSNDREREKLQKESYQQKIAFSVYTGVSRYFSKEKLKK